MHPSRGGHNACISQEGGRGARTRPSPGRGAHTSWWKPRRDHQHGRSCTTYTCHGGDRATATVEALVAGYHSARRKLWHPHLSDGVRCTSRGSGRSACIRWRGRRGAGPSQVGGVGTRTGTRKRGIHGACIPQGAAAGQTTVNELTAATTPDESAWSRGRDARHPPGSLRRPAPQTRVVAVRRRPRARARRATLHAAPGPRAAHGNVPGLWPIVGRLHYILTWCAKRYPARHGRAYARSPVSRGRESLPRADPRGHPVRVHEESQSTVI